MRFPLKRKIAVMIVSVVVLIGTVTILTCSSILSNTIKEHYYKHSIELSKTVAATVDTKLARSVRDEVLEIFNKAEDRVSSEEWGTPEFEEYIAQFSDIEKSEDFIELRDQLRAIQDVNDVNSIYLIYSDPVAEASVYIADAAYEDNCPPGCFDPYFDDDYALADDPDRGIVPVVTNIEAYGWIVTTGMPVNDEGEIIAYAGVDISMDDIATQQWKLILIVSGVILVFSVILSLIGVHIVNQLIIKPVKMLTETSEQYYSDDSAIVRHRFSELNIHTGDEIELLADAMAKMEDDLDVHIKNLLTTTKELASRADKLNMIASRDALTNAQNKRAYDLKVVQLNDDIKNGTAAFGIVMIDLNDLKLTNDTYGHEKGDVSIIELCGVLRSIFKDSPIFRIGGDEFAVILEGRKHEYADALLRALREKLTDLQNNDGAEPWERISAAVGYAEFERDTDPDVDAVFQRADQKMYENKQIMKSSNE